MKKTRCSDLDNNQLAQKTNSKTYMRAISNTSPTSISALIAFANLLHLPSNPGAGNFRE